MAYGIDGGKYHQLPCDILAHELVHAVHSTSGTDAPGYSFIPSGALLDRSIPPGEYKMRTEELSTHCNPCARSYIAEQEGIELEAVNIIDGKRQGVKLSKQEAAMEAAVLNFLQGGELLDDGDKKEVERILEARKTMFGIGEWQICAPALGRHMRPMYCGPSGTYWTFREYDICPDAPLENLATITSIEEAHARGR
ncbi:hypothetical protein [Streptomyces kronopolitis]|uniref:hypothetical protein n=1 Tax=Streptomyces kronopolitis TaxID=1612435 RepID=UPI0036D14A43